MGGAAEAFAERAAGARPSRVRSLLVAASVGIGAAALAYRLLRSGGGGQET